MLDNHQTFYSYIPAPDFCESGYEIGEKGVLGVGFFFVICIGFFFADVMVQQQNV